MVGTVGKREGGGGGGEESCDLWVHNFLLLLRVRFAHHCAG